MEEMKEIKLTKYLVTAGDTIMHNGKVYNGGAEIELTSEEAQMKSKHIILPSDLPQTIPDFTEQNKKLVEINQILKAENAELSSKLKSSEDYVAALKAEIEELTKQSSAVQPKKEIKK